MNERAPPAARPAAPLELRLRVEPPGDSGLWTATLHGPRPDEHRAFSSPEAVLDHLAWVVSGWSRLR